MSQRTQQGWEDDDDGEEEKQLFYLSDYRYGGCTSFTAHLLYVLRKKQVVCLTKAFEKDGGDFGYGTKYHKKPLVS